MRNRNPKGRLIAMILSKPHTYRKGIDPTENKIQMAIIELMRKTNMHKTGATFLAIPNDGRGGKAHRIHAWQMGQLSGAADIYLESPQGDPHFLEVKRCDGKQSDNQIAFENHCKAKGTPYAIARSLDDAKLILTHWGFGRFE